MTIETAQAMLKFYHRQYHYGVVPEDCLRRACWTYIYTLRSYRRRNLLDPRDRIPSFDELFGKLKENQSWS